METCQKAVIIAGGYGSRLAPAVPDVPKVLVEIGRRPLLDIILEQLRAAGFGEVVLALGHLGEQVEDYLARDPRRYEGFNLRTYHEEQPTGTAGALGLLSGLDETFLVMHGDVLTDLDFRALMTEHRASDALLTVAGARQDLRTESGVLRIEGGRLLGYDEKPTIRLTVSMGIYVYEPRLLESLPRGRRIDQPDVVKGLLDRGERVHCFESDCVWYDIGTVEGCKLTRQHFEAEPELFLPFSAVDC